MNTTNKVQVGSSTTGTTTTSTTASQWQTYTKPKAEQGWECPRCGRINAPWVRQCNCSENNWTITPAWNEPGWWRKVTCGEPDNVLNNPNYYTTTGGSDYWDNKN